MAARLPGPTTQSRASMSPKQRGRGEGMVKNDRNPDVFPIIFLHRFLHRFPK